MKAPTRAELLAEMPTVVKAATPLLRALLLSTGSKRAVVAALRGALEVHRRSVDVRVAKKHAVKRGAVR